MTPTSQRSSRRSACTHPPSIQRSPPHLTTPRFRQLCRTILARSPSPNIDALHCTAAASKHTSKSPLLTPTLRFQLNHPSSSNRAHFTHIVRFTIVILFSIYTPEAADTTGTTHTCSSAKNHTFVFIPTNQRKQAPSRSRPSYTFFFCTLLAFSSTIVLLPVHFLLRRMVITSVFLISLVNQSFSF